MSSANQFSGFKKDTVHFLEDIALNNTKEWFEKNRHIYESSIKKPSQEFVIVLGEKLKKISPAVKAIPAIDKSIFRIHRDTRFSRDKRPYKTFLGIFMWEGPGKKLDCSGYYFHLEPPNLMLGMGIYIFPPHLLHFYRRMVADDKSGTALIEAIKQSDKSGNYTLGEMHYKKVPQGYPADHPRADLLKYNGLHLGIETSIPDEFYKPDIVDYCYNIFEEMMPLHRWLVRMTEKAAEEK